MPEQLASGDRQVSVEPDVIRRHPCNEDTIAGRGAIEHIPDQDSASIDAPRIGVSPFGAERPIESNATAIGRARNRRVEIVVREIR